MKDLILHSAPRLMHHERKRLQRIAHRIAQKILEVWEECIREGHSATAGRHQKSLPSVARNGCVDNKAVTEYLKSRLSDDSAKVREAAAEALGELGDSETIHALTELLYHDATEVRKGAAQALAQIGTPRAITALLDIETRRIAVIALGWNSGPEVVDDEYAEARRDTASYLGRIASPSAICDLIDLLYDEVVGVRERANSELIDLPWHVFSETGSEKIREIYAGSQVPVRTDQKAFTKDGKYLIAHWQELARLPNPQ